MLTERIFFLEVKIYKYIIDYYTDEIAKIIRKYVGITNKNIFDLW